MKTRFSLFFISWFRGEAVEKRNLLQRSKRIRNGVFQKRNLSKPTATRVKNDKEGGTEKGRGE